MTRQVFLGLGVALLFLAASCEPGDSDDPLSPEPPVPSGSSVELHVHPTSIELYLPPPGDTATVYALLRNPDGRFRNGVGASFSSEDPAIATVDGSGKVTARSLGTTEITVSLAIDGETQSATARIDVVPPPPPPVAVDLAFLNSPGPAISGLALDTVRVVARDSGGRAVTSFEGRVDLSLSGGSGSSPRDLATAWAVAGIATFPDLRVREPGTGYVLRARSEGLAGATSAPFDVAPPAAGRIAFVSDREGTPKIFVTNADGSGLRRLTSGPGEDRRPAWSPDGRRIAFARAGDSSICGIYSMNADGSGLQRLTSACGDITPAWSPDGRTIAFAKWTLGSLSTGIYVMNADGTDPRRLTEAVHDEYPAWSPDGQRIAFNHTTESDGEWFTQVYVMNADGTDPRKLTPPGGAQFAESGPSWSIDGSVILFWSYGYGIATAFGGGGNPMTLYKGTHDLFSIGNVGYYSTPGWSPDGHYVVFAAGGLGQRAVYIARAFSGRSPQRLSIGSNGEDYEPAWAAAE